MPRRPTPGSVTDLVQMLVAEGFTDEQTVTSAVRDAQPSASPARIRKALATEIVRASETRNK